MLEKVWALNFGPITRVGEAADGLEGKRWTSTHSTILRIHRFSQHLLLLSRDYTILQGQTSFMSVFSLLPERVLAFDQYLGRGLRYATKYSQSYSGVGLDHGLCGLGCPRCP